MPDTLDEKINRTGVKLKAPVSDNGASLLRRIATELSSIQEEISKIKTDITQLTLSTAAAAGAKQIAQAVQSVQAVPQSGAPLVIEDQQQEEQQAEGFFGSEDEADETIALSDDEILNILNNPTFTKTDSTEFPAESAESLESSESLESPEPPAGIEQIEQIEIEQTESADSAGTADISSIAINLDTEPEMSANNSAEEAATWNQIAQRDAPEAAEREVNVPRSIEEVAEENIAELTGEKHVSDDTAEPESAGESDEDGEEEDVFSFDDEEEDAFSFGVQNDDAAEADSADAQASEETNLREYSGDIIKEAEEITEEPPFPHGEIETSTLVDAEPLETEKDFDVLPDIDLPKDAPEFSPDTDELTPDDGELTPDDSTLDTSELTLDDGTLDDGELTPDDGETALDTSEIDTSELTLDDSELIPDDGETSETALDTSELTLDDSAFEMPVIAGKEDPQAENDFAMDVPAETAPEENAEQDLSVESSELSPDTDELSFDSSELKLDDTGEALDLTPSQDELMTEDTDASAAPDESAENGNVSESAFDMPLSVPSDIAETVFDTNEPTLDTSEPTLDESESSFDENALSLDEGESSFDESALSRDESALSRDESALSRDESQNLDGDTESADGARANDFAGGLKQDVKNLLSYMDNLLENLPESKIEEFARSEQYDLYKKIFNELGLA
ncbi:MAG: hypothetical protein Ta2A_22570 [Treponemataceae bacterium]|nr:MAG: hypothetical protein Ta2A_22570 [Treponemataceae bacterium]